MRVITSSGNQIMDGKDWDGIERVVKTSGGGDTAHQPMPKECPNCGCKRMVKHPNGRKGLYQCTKCDETISRNYITPQKGSWADQEAKKREAFSKSLKKTASVKDKNGMEQVNLSGLHTEINARNTKVASSPRTDIRMNIPAFSYIQENYPNIAALFKQANTTVINAISMVIDDLANGSLGSFQGLADTILMDIEPSPEDDIVSDENAAI